MDEPERAKRRFKFPFAAVGAIVGALFTTTISGPTTEDTALQVVLYVGLGALAGEALGWANRDT